jgi:uncharacterized protein YkwD
MHRRRFLILLPSGLALAGCAGGGAPSRRVASAGPPVVRAVNVAEAAAVLSRYRAASGLGPVRPDATLNAAALQQARAVAEAGDLFHGDFTGRMTAYGVRAAAAENLSMGPGTVEAVIAQWRGSPGHNRNLLGDYDKIGLARVDSGRPFWAMVLAR